jgi:hypothetical protein
VPVIVQTISSVDQAAAGQIRRPNLNYDNRRISAIPNIALQNHFFININGVRICFCYIRKNASSSFKKLMMDYTPFTYNPDLYSGKLDFFRKKHSACLPIIRHDYDATIVVLRDPVKRAVSLFVNKAVAQTYAVKFSKNYQNLTGRDPVDSNFRQFVMSYLQNPWRKLDLHVWPQYRQLWPINYTHAFLDQDLTRQMSRLVGPEITAKYFSGTVNASPRGEKNGIEDVLDRPAHELAALLDEYDVNAELQHAAATHLEDTLKEIYSADYNLLARFSAGVSTNQG